MTESPWPQLGTTLCWKGLSSFCLGRCRRREFLSPSTSYAVTEATKLRVSEEFTKLERAEGLVTQAPADSTCSHPARSCTLWMCMSCWAFLLVSFPIPFDVCLVLMVINVWLYRKLQVGAENPWGYRREQAVERKLVWVKVERAGWKTSCLKGIWRELEILIWKVILERNGEWGSMWFGGEESFML